MSANLITVDVPGLTAQATRIIAALNWTGPLQLEFKWDAANKEFLLIEINPRFWGTTGAWLRAGLNFPGVAVDLAMGRDVHDSVKLDKDLRFKYLIGRTPYALIQLLRAKGLAELRDPKKFSQTWYDFDIRDPVPDLCRVYKEFRKVLRGDRLLVDNTLPANLIPAYMDIPD